MSVAVSPAQDRRRARLAYLADPDAEPAVIWIVEERHGVTHPHPELE